MTAKNAKNTKREGMRGWGDGTYRTYGSYDCR